MMNTAGSSDEVAVFDSNSRMRRPNRYVYASPLHSPHPLQVMQAEVHVWRCELYTEQVERSPRILIHGAKHIHLALN
jgi:hypothetical protein